MKQGEVLVLVGAAALAVYALGKKGEGIGGITTILPSAAGGGGFAMPTFPELAFTMPELSFTMPELNFGMPEFNLPDWPEFNLPDWSDMPGVPGMPDLPDLPGIPDLPGLPNLPGMPDLIPDWTARGIGEWAGRSVVGGAVDLIRGGLAGAYEAVEPEREAWKAAAKGFTQEPVKTAFIPGYGLYQAYQGMKESMSEGASKEAYLAGTATRETGVEEANLIIREMAAGIRDEYGKPILTAATKPGATQAGSQGESVAMTIDEEQEKARLLNLAQV